jgi:hypothetical protein
MFSEKHLPVELLRESLDQARHSGVVSIGLLLGLGRKVGGTCTLGSADMLRSLTALLADAESSLKSFTGKPVTAAALPDGEIESAKFLKSVTREPIEAVASSDDEVESATLEARAMAVVLSVVIEAAAAALAEKSRFAAERKLGLKARLLQETHDRREIRLTDFCRILTDAKHGAFGALHRSKEQSNRQANAMKARARSIVQECLREGLITDASPSNSGVTGAKRDQRAKPFRLTEHGRGVFERLTGRKLAAVGEEPTLDVSTPANSPGAPGDSSMNSRSLPVAEVAVGEPDASGRSPEPLSLIAAGTGTGQDAAGRDGAEEFAETDDRQRAGAVDPDSRLLAQFKSCERVLDSIEIPSVADIAVPLTGERAASFHQEFDTLLKLHSQGQETEFARWLPRPASVPSSGELRLHSMCLLQLRKSIKSGRKRLEGV